MVRGKNDYGVFFHSTLLQHLQKLANVIIDVTHSTVICSPSPLDSFLRWRFVPQIADLEQSLAVCILFFLRDLDVWLGNINALIPVPVRLVYSVWVVWVCKRNSKAKRTGRRWPASGSIEVSGGFEHNLFIKIELIRAYAWPSL